MGNMFFRFAEEEPYSGKVLFDGGKPFSYQPCDKCNGQGVIDIYRHNANGICFDCYGDKVTRFRLYTEKQVASQLRRIAKAEKQKDGRAQINQEIAALYAIKQSVRQGFWNIAKLRERAESEHIGKIGQRIEIDATMIVCIGFDNFYGTTYINTMKDADGNVFVYKGSNRLAKNGEKVSIKATVKEHGVYKGVKQTVVNRPSKMKGE
jgi:hypothetical protein